MSVLRWDERIRRARYLSDKYPAAADVLTFYRDLAGFQRSLAERWQLAVDDRTPADTLLEGLNKPRVLGAVPEFVTWLDRAAPAHVADTVSKLVSREWSTLLDHYLTSLGSGAEVDESPQAFVLEALLQPLAELHAERRSTALTAHTSRCPFCNSLPVVGVLREEGEGASRSLVCGLCLAEWRHLRVVCLSCGENKFDALAVYTAEQIPGARVDACDSCRVYLKTIDMTKDGHAVPVVDDLASISLDLWAREQGYVRLRPNLLRT